MKNTEIERKWLVSGWPPESLPLTARQFMRQGYLSVHPTVRIREESTQGGNTEYILCFKTGGGIVRRELEWAIEKEKFDELESMIGLPLIKKERRLYQLRDGLTLEVSIVDEGMRTSFWYAEVEFPTPELAHTWTPEADGLSAYLSREVSEIPGQTMGAYWVRTRTYPE